MNIFTDIMVLALPIPMIQQLKLGKRDKVMLYGLFLLGGLVTTTSILRTTSVQNSLKNRMDITFNFITRGIWTLVEANLGIIIPCLVIIKQPLGILLPRMFGTSNAHVPCQKRGGDIEKGYPLSTISTGLADGLWQGSNLAQQSVSISGPGTQAGRRSDEQHIVSDVPTDSDSRLDGKVPVAARGISKTVELVRTSIYQDRSYHHIGGFSSLLDTSEPSSGSKKNLL
ncbi:hypothetical protein V2A60_002944 [Cordyceps javanica]|uniref:Short-chain dehydrogenase n=1 Tax=Cordyceps javanica TaxID=43265 RepID=A0A545V4N2_9HYPO|nr:short-chain dehydrogenase [Cordyceps javanica]TQW07944.1 short-chain dehydrogenase [Cordyceps javanica]